jgi:hypothetical protein
MRHYLYRHIRLDKNEPFYIGIGTKKDKLFSSVEIEYHRAYSKFRKDSRIWNFIQAKTKYEVEILFESDYEFIKEKEKEFISLYGRIDLKTGTLSNMTDGGDGTLGWIPSEENLDNLRKSKIGKDYKYLGNKIFQYDLNGNFLREWDTIKDASLSIKRSKSSLSKVTKFNLNGNYCNGFYWSLDRKDKIETKPFNGRKFNGYKKKELCHV